MLIFRECNVKFVDVHRERRCSRFKLQFRELIVSGNQLDFVCACTDHQRLSVFNFEMIFVVTTRGYNAMMSDDCLIMMSSSSCQIIDDKSR